MELHIDKVYYWNGEEVAVCFMVVDTKAEKKICEILERDRR